MNTPFSRTLRSLGARRNTSNVIILLILGIVILSWLLWFVFAHIRIFEISSDARLEVYAAIFPIQATRDGQVADISVSLGQKVNKGDVLIRLDSQREALELKEYQAQLLSLNDEILAIDKEIEAVKEAGQHDIVANDASVQEAMAKYKEANIASRFAQNRLSRLEKLSRQKQVSEIDLAKVRSEAQQKLASADVQKRALKRIKNTGSTTESNQKAKLERLKLEKVQSEGKKEITEATIKKLRYDIDSLTIKAPASGHVGNLSEIQVGSVVKAGDQLGSIVPEGKLKAIAFFDPASAIGRIKRNQKGRLNIKGFPWTQYGSLSVTVTKVAKEVRNSLIKVELAVDANSTSSIPLQHGMPATAEIEIETATPAIITLRAAGKLIGKAKSLN